jgi:acyl carrier protein
MDALDEVIGMDSMAVLEFVAGLEQEFGVRFPPADLELDLFRSRPRLVAYLERFPGPPGGAP